MPLILDASLNEWPRPLGLWPLNVRFGAKDVKSSGKVVNHGEIFNSFPNVGPFGKMKGSYELRGMNDSYFEIDNTNKAVGPLNSLTFSMWLYPTEM